MGDIMYDSVYQRNRRHTHNKDVTALTLDPSSSNMGDFLFNEQTAFEEVDTPFTGMETMVDEDRWQLPSVRFGWFGFSGSYSHVTSSLFTDQFFITS